MITKIEVDGFKSLKDFSLNLNKGLNILVGPNGAGKTNIVLFFEFLSGLVSNQIGNAISQVGGAGTIFQKIGKDTYADNIRIKIYGCYQTNSNKFIVYEYSFEIKISFEKDDVFYSNQEIKLRNASKFWSSPEEEGYRDVAWALHVKYEKSEDEKSGISLLAYDKKKFKEGYIHFNKSKPSEVREFFLNQNLTYRSIVRCLFPLTGSAQYILIDLIGGETFNVIPSKVRELEDSATPPSIKKDGSGLATTLYAMKKSKSKGITGTPMFILDFEDFERTYNPETLDKIVDFLKLANSTITSLDVDNDPFNNKLIVKITIKTGNYEAVLPLSAMSDGTIKWLTLITAILTSKTIFSIEEPENFLHPWMQAEIA